jgi:hypothetical protein
MKSTTNRVSGNKGERGSTLYIVAGSLVAFLGLVGLAIDLVALYVGRSEAQRAADAAALAGARMFVTSTYTSGGVPSTALCPTSATNPPTGLSGTAALTAGEANTVGGQTLTASAFTATCDFSHDVVSGISDDPLITVSVTASMPTYFMKIFGLNSENVSASATAEAFNPVGAGATGPSFCLSCLKPFLVPNCDPSHSSPPSSSSNCSGEGVFITASNTIANPGLYPNGVVGEPWALHSSQNPSHWYELAFDATPPGCNGGQGAPAWETSVEQCSTSPITCGTQLCTLEGKKVGPNNFAVSDLITYGTNASHSCKPCSSVDTITFNAALRPPYTITAGAGNPFAPAGSTITQSASLVTVPLFNGDDVSSGPANVTVVGYVQMFIEDINHHGNDDEIDALILNVTSCGNTQGPSCSSTSGVAQAGGASFIPVRLVQHP